MHAVAVSSPTPHIVAKMQSFLRHGQALDSRSPFSHILLTGGSSRNSGRLCFRYSPQLDCDKSAVGSPA